MGIQSLPFPLNTIVIEINKGGYRDFGVSENNPYPLKGVTYATDYGYLPGYVAEDGAELDFFVGSEVTGKCGYIAVWRSETVREHKVYICLSEDELARTLKAFNPVVTLHEQLGSLQEVTEFIKPFKK